MSENKGDTDASQIRKLNLKHQVHDYVENYDATINIEH